MSFAHSIRIECIGWANTGMSRSALFVINLDRSADRLADMRRHLSSLTIAFERFPAIEGRNLPAAIAKQFRMAQGLSDGEVGCYASHLAVAKRVVDDRLAYAIVLEDDVHVAPDLIDACSDVADVAPNGWHIIHIAAKPKRSAVRLADVGTRALVQFSRVPTNAAGYMISYGGAQKFVAPRSRVLPIDVDVHCHAVSGLDVYGVLPSIVVQNRSGTSTIGAGRHRKTYLTLAQKLHNIRHLCCKVGLLKYVAVTAANIEGSIRRRIFGGRHFRVL